MEDSVRQGSVMHAEYTCCYDNFCNGHGGLFSSLRDFDSDAKILDASTFFKPTEEVLADEGKQRTAEEVVWREKRIHRLGRSTTVLSSATN